MSALFAKLLPPLLAAWFSAPAPPPCPRVLPCRGDDGACVRWPDSVCRARGEVRRGR